MGRSSTWRPLATFIVRPAGFAFAKLGALRFERSSAAAHALATATGARVAIGKAFDTALSQERFGERPELDDPTVRKAFSKHVKRTRAFARRESTQLPADGFAEIARMVPALAPMIRELRDTHLKLAAAEHDLEAVFTSELDVKRAALRDAYRTDDRLREAVFLESPEAYERIVQLIAADGPRDARARQRERLAVMYLQRFCAKNDTNSIGGPHAIATLAEHAVTPRIAIAGDDHRRAYVSHWAASRLLEVASERAGGAAVVPVRLRPTAVVGEASAAWCLIEHDATVMFRRRYASVNLPPDAIRLLALLAERPRLLAELAAEVADAGDLIEAMRDAGIVIDQPAITPGTFYPLADLRAQLASWPACEARDWGDARAGELEALFAEFTGAALPERIAIYHRLVERFREATGDSGARGQGRHYADRSILHEDCHAAITADVGAETVAPLLAGLAPLLSAASLPLELTRETVREWFRGRFGEGTRVAALVAHRAFDEERAAELACTTPAAEQLRAAIARVVECFAAATTDAAGTVRVRAVDLTAAVGDAAGTRPGYVSIDVMLNGAPDTAPELVIGEVHGFLWLPTCLLDVVPEPHRARALADIRETVRTVAEHRPTAECLFAHTQATDRRFPITDADLLVLDPSDREAVAFGRLELALEADTFRFFDGEREIVPLATYTTYPFLLYTSRLAPLIDDFATKFFPDALLPEALRAGDTPRLRCEGLTFRRRTWRRTAGELAAVLAGAKDSALFVRAQELRRLLACPALVFASIPEEPKPVLLDFDDFFLIETFAHLLERLAESAVVRFTEMLPGPDELFATAADGRRTSELRMGVYRVPAPTQS